MNSNLQFDSDSNSELLSHKLHELMLIIDEYESELEGRYIDSEDYISMYVSLIGEFDVT